MLTGSIERLIEMFTDPALSGEARASILAYTRGRLDAQREGKFCEAPQDSQNFEKTVTGRGDSPESL